MNQQPRPFNMTQKLVTEPFPFVGPFDDPWDIGHDTGAFIPEAHNAQLWDQSGKWIWRDFRVCRRDACQECRFPSIGQAHQADIG
jgi:hypothetical protein